MAVGVPTRCRWPSWWRCSTWSRSSGATLATVAAAAGALGEGVWACLIVVAVFIVYQQIENHLLQPLIYGRTVQLSPLMVLISILIAGSIAGIIGALIAIPIAGSLQVVLWS